MLIRIPSPPAPAPCLLTHFSFLFTSSPHALILTPMIRLYNSTSYLDDLAWASAWLALATNNVTALHEAHMWIRSMPGGAASALGRRTATYDWDNVLLGALTLMADVSNDNEAQFRFMLPVRLAMADFLRGAPTVPNGPIYTAPGGIPVVSQWGNLRYAAAQAAISLQLARQYNTLNEVESNVAYACFTQQVLRQALGECCVRKSGGVGGGHVYGERGVTAAARLVSIN